MSKRVDHAAEAREFMEASQLVASQHELPAADLAVKHAQVHATLALVEQQRLANVITLATFLAGNQDAKVTPIERQAWLALAQNGTGIAHPDIAAALGIGADDE